MSPKKAKKQLRKMLRSFTPGSVLMLFGEVFGELAREARKAGMDVIAANYQNAEATMVVVGLGLDAILPKPEVR